MESWDFLKNLSAWGSQSSFSVDQAWGVHLTDKLRANKIGYVISFGGASGEDISKACTEAQLIAAYEQVIKTYQPRGLDFDIENGSANVAKVMTALKQVQTNHPALHISFTLPVLPEGLTYSGEDIVKQATAINLNYSVNIMAMDYGSAYPSDMGDYAIQAANNLFAFLKNLYPAKTEQDLWKMVEVTPMIGVNDVNVEQFTLSDADILLAYAQKNNLNSLSIWSISRDNPCADK